MIAVKLSAQFPHRLPEQLEHPHKWSAVQFSTVINAGRPLVN